jgi:hypothetical protein
MHGNVTWLDGLSRRIPDRHWLPKIGGQPYVALDPCLVNRSLLQFLGSSGNSMPPASIRLPYERQKRLNWELERTGPRASSLYSNRGGLVLGSGVGSSAGPGVGSGVFSGPPFAAARVPDYIIRYFVCIN